MEKINCEIIKDLLPGYVEGLTSDYTNQAVSTHLETCNGCREIYEAMTREMTPPAGEKIPEPARLTAFFRKVQSGAFIKGILIASVIFLVIEGLSSGWKYVKDRVPVPLEAVSAESYQMEDGSVYVCVRVEEEYPVTHGWEWTSDLPIRVQAGMDQMRYSWLYWLEAHLPVIGGEYDTNEMVLIIPEAEAEEAVVLYEESGGDEEEVRTKILYEHETGLPAASEEMEQRVKDHEVYNYWLVDAPGYEAR